MEALWLLPAGCLAVLVYRQLPKPLCPVSFDPFLLLPVTAAMASLRYILAGAVTLFFPKKDGRGSDDCRKKTLFWCFVSSLGFAVLHLAGIAGTGLLRGETVVQFANRARFIFLLADLVPIITSGAVWLLSLRCAGRKYGCA